MHYAGTLRRHHVKSTAVRSVGYDEADWILQVEMAGGQVCNYYRVPPDEYAKLMRASSVGAYLQREIEPYYEHDEEDGTDE
jgi:hypothetical protein